MSDWNPVEGLEKINIEDVRIGDEIRAVYREAKAYVSATQGVVSNKTTDFLSDITLYADYGYEIADDNCEIYLVERPVMEEPKELGSTVWITRHEGIYVLVKISEAPGTHPWLVLDYWGKGHLVLRGWAGVGQVSWDEITKYNPQPYEWGMHL